VLIADEVVFTEAALAEYVEAKSKGGSVKPDLATREIPGGIPSIAPAEGEGTVETTTAAEAAPAKKAAKKAPATKAAADAPAKKAAATKAPAEAGDDAPAKKAAAKKAPATTAAADETTEEKA
jgi:large subunit ribosomal protein L4